MSFEQLKAIIGDNAEAKTIIDSLESASTNNVAKINDLETKFNEAKNGRDSLKNLIRETTGLDEVNADSINDFVTKLKSTKGDEKLTAEIDNLKGLIEKANGEKESIVSEYESKLQNMALTNSLRDLGIGSLAVNPLAEKMMLEHLKEGASLDGDKIVYRNADGSTMYNGTNVLTPADKLEQMKTSDDWKAFIKGDVNSGSGARESNGNANNNIKTNGSKEDLVNSIAKKYNL